MVFNMVNYHGIRNTYFRIKSVHRLAILVARSVHIRNGAPGWRAMSQPPGAVDMGSPARAVSCWSGPAGREGGRAVLVHMSTGTGGDGVRGSLSEDKWSGRGPGLEHIKN